MIIRIKSAKEIISISFISYIRGIRVPIHYYYYYYFDYEFIIGIKTGNHFNLIVAKIICQSRTNINLCLILGARDE